MPSTSHQILILDDHRLFADGLSMILAKLATKPTIKTETNPQRVLEDEFELKSYDLILVDLQMPRMSGFDFLQAISKRKITVPTILVSSTENRSDIEKALKLGAQGFIPKNSPTHDMLTGIQTVLNGKKYVPEHLVGSINWPTTNAVVNNTNPSQVCLSPRQIEVLHLMHTGHSNTQIATILDISESTVKGHISSLFKTFNVKNRTACVRAGIENQLIEH